MRHDNATGAMHPGSSTTWPAGSAAGFREVILRDLPLVEYRHDLAGIATAALEGGEGPTVVLVHGPGEFAALWGRVVPGLTETHHVVVPDLPGHGATGLPTDGPLDAERWLEWLRALIARTTSRPRRSWGIWRAGPWPCAMLSKEVRSSASCWSTPPDWRSTRRHRRSRPRSPGSSPTRPSAAGTASSAGACTTSTACGGELGTRWDPFAAYALAGVQERGARSAVLSFAIAFGMFPVRRRDLQRIPVPVSMIWGRHDLQNRLRIAEVAAERLGWPLEVIEEARDDPCWERPDAAVAALRAALARPLRRHVPA